MQYGHRRLLVYFGISFVDRLCINQFSFKVASKMQLLKTRSIGSQQMGLDAWYYCRFVIWCILNQICEHGIREFDNGTKKEAKLSFTDQPRKK